MRASLLAALAVLVLTTPAGATTLTQSTPEWKVVAAGDIASCDSSGAADTSALVQSLAPDAVLTLGDNAYPDGAFSDFRDCYQPTWGAFRTKTFPAPGNHDYHTAGAKAYFDYFGPRARGRFYSFDLGPWHIVSLNSEVPHGYGSRQVRWLRHNLAGDSRRCEVLYWHRPRWSGGAHGSDPGMSALWRAAYDHGVELVLAGHDHNYQRFYKLDAYGRSDRRYGARQVVAGTGGKSLYDTGPPMPRRAAASSSTHGVIELTLRAGGYDLRFVPVAGSSWTDVLPGRTCHGPPW